MTLAARVLACVLAGLALAVTACGGTERVREPDLVVRGEMPPERGGPTRPAPTRDPTDVRIAVVTHGQASSSFWIVVRNGIDAAARQLDVTVDYRSPDTYSVARMEALIDAAVESQPDALVVSIPSLRLAPAIRRAEDAGIPVMSINSGGEVFRSLGVLAHVGQPEERAGVEAGRRLAAEGVRRAVCVVHEIGNSGLEARCNGFRRALRRVRGIVQTLAVDVQDRDRTRAQIADAIRTRRLDGILTLNVDAADAALDATRSADRRAAVTLATFDLSPSVLSAVRRGRLAFAIDQQAYLQGYLPIMLLTQRIRYGLFPSEHELIPTGPSFVTRADAGRVLRLADQGIR